MKQKIVIALGGNALGETPSEQRDAVAIAARSIVDLIALGHDVTVVHGNGPQVGMIHLAFDIAAQQTEDIPEMPFAEASAMSQGYIGYHLQNAVGNELRERTIDKSVATVLTQVVVDKQDPAFTTLTKPIGPFYDEVTMLALSEKNGYTYIEDSGRGYRRVVASPMPVTVVERDAIKSLVDAGVLVISNGGGGIPVIEENGKYVGVDAVIDKDNAASKVADEIDADILVILTGVDKVAIHYGKFNQEWLTTLTIPMANQYINEGHFAPGSMLPKVEASVRFVEGRQNRKAIITSLENAHLAISEGNGTTIQS
ncbi:carbamate kinase [Erysipelothrix sp. HDW6C]|uniref:carbamate kinase n=1 Tax=Erysipelothrix sp. HDW6C TaxID=2714930 RepID=UPI00140D8AB9|nr:carbamate kinase [Erysipelothrix sp. HDW6C]QIK69404.1 carbamate kinase [Erysipelothrix sp. HDW6C]